MHAHITLRPCSVNSMVDESSNEPKLFPTRKKKLTFKHFFIFSFDILKSCKVFYQIGSISIKIFSKSHENRLNFPTTASEQIFNIFNFFSSDEGKKALSGSVDHRILRMAQVRSSAFLKLKLYSKVQCFFDIKIILF